MASVLTCWVGCLVIISTFIKASFPARDRLLSTSGRRKQRDREIVGFI